MFQKFLKETHHSLWENMFLPPADTSSLLGHGSAFACLRTVRMLLLQGL